MFNRAATISRSSIEQTSLSAQQQQARGRADQSGSDVTLPTIEFQYRPANTQREILEPRGNTTTTTSSPQHCCIRAPAMSSLILVVFVIQLAIHLISTFGGQAINDLVLPTIHICDAAESDLSL